ncbi:MAG: hypothetical protein HPY50_12190 [Firmicutes bacterium]|nr:hypothetical protein [Bacillota bacterium]
MSDLLCLLILIAAVPATVIWGWTGWFLLLSTGELVFSLAHRGPESLGTLGGLLLMALGIEWMVLRARRRTPVPEGLIKRVVISGGTQLVLGSFFHHLAALAVWWMGLGRFLWERPAEEIMDELGKAVHWSWLMLARGMGALAAAVVILWCM